MMKRSFFAASSIALIAATPALAGGYEPPVVETPVVAPVVAQGMNWEGGYVGAHLGYGSGSIEDVNNPQAAKQDTDGFIGGVQVGYNWHLPSNLVLGVEAGLSAMDIKADWTGDGAYYGTDKHKWGVTLRGRVGYAMDNLLPYLHAGFARAKNEHMLGCGLRDVHGSNCRETSFEKTESHSVNGYVIGAGFEYAVDQNWSIRGEYAYTNYGKNRLLLVDDNFPTSDVNNRNFKSDHHSIKLGVNYRF